MDDKIKETLTRILENVMEELAFMFGGPASKDEISTEEDKFLHINMGFKGQWSGKLGIAIPAGLGTIIASNILGIDEDEDEAEGKSVDALKEFLNTVCGQFLTVFYGEEPVFDLTVPDVSEIDGTGWEEFLNHPESIIMTVEEIPLITYISQ